MQDGKSANLTAPNGLAQELLMQSALADANVLPQDVSYLEAHGTGTKLGDPIEAEAVVNVYCRQRNREDPLFVGGVKATVGHLEAAAGMAGLFSVLVCLATKSAPGNCRLKVLNKNIEQVVSGAAIEFPRSSVDLRDSASQQQQQQQQQQQCQPMLAALSSFGYSGTIAHMILESWEKSDVSRLLMGPKKKSEGSVEGRDTVSGSFLFVVVVAFINSFSLFNSIFVQLYL